MYIPPEIATSYKQIDDVKKIYYLCKMWKQLNLRYFYN